MKLNYINNIGFKTIYNNFVALQLTCINMSSQDILAIENFKDFLRIKTEQPNPDYDASTNFLKKQAQTLKLKVQVFNPEPNKPIVIMTWPGTQPELPTILLNCHTDVVPADPADWTYPPFDAQMDENGDIWARGSQDMKCVGTMYLEAIRRLQEQGVQCKRTIHLSFVPDEEIGGHHGMALFVQTDDFKKLNVAFALDEGGVVPVTQYPVVYGEKAIWQVVIHCPGTPSHGSQMLPNSPGDKLRYIIDKFLDMRKANVEESGDGLTKDFITSVNLTRVNGGVQENVVPDEMSAVFDLRIALDEDLVKFEEMINQWCVEAGSDVNIEYLKKDPVYPASIMDESNIFWTAFTGAAEKLGITLFPLISPGNSDSRFMRGVGVSAFGFTPINEQPMLQHAIDERVNKDRFLKGIGMYQEIIPAIANA